MTRCFKLSPTANAHPADVVAAKIALRGLGHYEAPDWGISEYPDRELFDAIKDFQAKQGLKVDGVINSDGETVQAMAQRLQAMGRNGGTILAHINPAEAQLLDRVTDGGSINPLTGLLEYNWFSDALDAIGDFFGGNDDNKSDDTSGKNSGGTDGSGESNNNAPAEDTTETSPGPDAEGEGEESEQASSPEGPSVSQQADAMQKGDDEEEDETLGANGMESNNSMQNPSDPSKQSDKEDTTPTKSEVHEAMAAYINDPSGQVTDKNGATRTNEEVARDKYEDYLAKGEDILGIGTQYGYMNFNVSEQPAAEGSWDRSEGRYLTKQDFQKGGKYAGQASAREEAEDLSANLSFGSPMMPTNGYVGLDGKRAPAGLTSPNTKTSYVLDYLDRVDPLEEYVPDLSAYGWLDEEEADKEQSGAQRPSEEWVNTEPRMNELGDWFDYLGNPIADPYQTAPFLMEAGYRVGKNAPKPSNDLERFAYDYFPEIYDRVMNPDRNQMFNPKMTTVPENRRAELAANILGAAVLNELGRMLEEMPNPTNAVNKGLRDGLKGVIQAYTEDALDPTGKMKSNALQHLGQMLEDHLDRTNFSKSDKSKSTSPQAQSIPSQQKTVDRSKRRQQRKDVITSGAQAIFDGFLANEPLTTEEWARQRARKKEDDMKIK